MISKKNTLTIKSLLFFTLTSTTMLAQAPERGDWFNLDYNKDKVHGVSADRAYETLLKNKKGEKVVVGVIDSGVEVDHEDLVNVMWTNPGEIAGDKKDNDNNGYIDDIHGWNFLGNPNGENVNHDNLEVARLYSKLRTKYQDAPEPKNADKNKEYQLWLAVKEEVETKREQALTVKSQIEFQKNMILSSLDAVATALGDREINEENLNAIEDADQSVTIGKSILLEALKEGEDLKNISEIKETITEQIEGGIDYYNGQYNFHYNPDFNPRSIVADNYNNSYEKGYGNNDYEGPDAAHGTHVAGIIAAERGNNLGIEGVCADCLIMTLRAVPDGDERDKDVANSIIYAVDNGAKVINMSFGKGYSWDKKAVDKAVKYAAKQDVLLVHAAGNSSQDNDVENNFPNDGYDKKSRNIFARLIGANKKAKNWLEVGASTYHTDHRLVASFSNYGKNNVDVFAPGFQINAPVPDNTYQKFSGTSMAAPVVAGIAGVIRSQYPNLSAKDVKEIIMESSVKIDQEVLIPGSKENKTHFKNLSKSGGIANLYNALELAAKKSK